MSDGRRYMVDVGMYKFPFPIKVLTRDYPEGQPTIADISVHARILKEFEANWIDRFVQVVHQHKDNISPTAIKQNIVDYQEAFGATSVRINLDYPLFMAKMTPVSKQKCLVKYDCVSSTKLGSSGFAQNALLSACPRWQVVHCHRLGGRLPWRHQHRGGGRAICPHPAEPAPRRASPPSRPRTRRPASPRPARRAPSGPSSRPTVCSTITPSSSSRLKHLSKNV